MVWKELDYGTMSDSEKQMLVSEVNLLRELKHEHIVRYYDRIIDRSSTTLYIVMEYCEGGDLASLVNKCKNEGWVIDITDGWENLCFVLKCVMFLFIWWYQPLQASCWRRPGLAHMCPDCLCPQRVSLTAEKWQGCVAQGPEARQHLPGWQQQCETGWLWPGKSAEPRHQLCTDICGHTVLHVTSERDLIVALLMLLSVCKAFTAMWCYGVFQEQMNYMSYNEKSDVWSLGCLLYELCALRPPFTAANQRDLTTRIRAGRYTRLPLRYSQDLNEVISSMLRVDVSISCGTDCVQTGCTCGMCWKIEYRPKPYLCITM